MARANAEVESVERVEVGVEEIITFTSVDTLEAGSPVLPDQHRCISAITKLFCLTMDSRTRVNNPTSHLSTQQDGKELDPATSQMQVLTC